MPAKRNSNQGKINTMLIPQTLIHPSNTSFTSNFEQGISSTPIKSPIHSNWQSSSPFVTPSPTPKNNWNQNDYRGTAISISHGSKPRVSDYIPTTTGSYESYDSPTANSYEAHDSGLGISTAFEMSSDEFNQLGDRTYPEQVQQPQLTFATNTTIEQVGFCRHHIQLKYMRGTSSRIVSFDCLTTSHHRQTIIQGLLCGQSPHL